MGSAAWDFFKDIKSGNNFACLPILSTPTLPLYAQWHIPLPTPTHLLLLAGTEGTIVCEAEDSSWWVLIPEPALLLLGDTEGNKVRRSDPPTMAAVFG